MTEDQFVEIVQEAIDRHISTDPTIVREDTEWEERNVARVISKLLRQAGIPLIPEIE